jgi:5'-nucleotidase
MTRNSSILLSLALLSGCATVPRGAAPRAAAAAPIEVQILALNDFHGNLRPSGPVTSVGAGGKVTVPMQGGVAQMGAMLQRLRTPASITVAAGDLIGATPLESAYFLDEPAIDAMNMIGLELASVGNHEFDKGARELLRIQNGGCATVSTIASRRPCRVEPFTGARFRYLAANVRTADGSTLFPATALRQLGPVRIGFIGMTLKDTATLVTPAGVAGLRFEDEAATANALVPELKAAGADAIVLLIHQGGKTPDSYRTTGCDGLSGAIMPILDQLDPAIATVVSGHTHNAYTCALNRGGATRTLTSAGKNGYFVTDIRLRFDAASHALLSETAANVAIASGGAAQADVAALVDRYVAAAAPEASRLVGRLSGPATYSDTGEESPLARLVADAQLAATRSKARGGAQIGFINASGVRTNLTPAADGSITYGQIFALQPFGNSLVVKTLTGAQLKAVLEQQVNLVDGKPKVTSLLVPSRGFGFAYDLTKPVGARVSRITLGGRPIDPARRYRIVVNNFLASGGDGFSDFNAGSDPFDAGLDLDALEAWLRTSPKLPTDRRVDSGE